MSGSCNLSSINISEYVNNPYTNEATFDSESLGKDIYDIVKAMDKVVDYGAKYHTLESQRKTQLDYRNIGIGIMGLGSMFMKMGMKYGSAQSIEFSAWLMKFIFRKAVKTSNQLAAIYGSFPKYKECVWDSAIIKNAFTTEEIDQMRPHGLRNCSLISIAPTGSIGTMLNVTTGIEPAFRISYKRTTKSLHRDHDVTYDVHVKEADEYMRVNKTDTLPDYFVGSNEIYWEDRVKLQAFIQEYVDTAISSTLNLPEGTTKETISKAYYTGYKMGLKGMTVFVDNCKKLGILTTGTPKKEEPQKVEESSKQVTVRNDNNTMGDNCIIESDKLGLSPHQTLAYKDSTGRWVLNDLLTNYETVSKEEVIPKFGRGDIESVPDGLTYRKYKLYTGCGTLYLFVGYDEDEGKIYDIFTNTGGSGGCFVNTEANSRMISACLRGGVPVEYIIEQLNKTDVCPSFQYKRGKGDKLSPGRSCPSAIANVLKGLVDEIKNNDEYEDIDEVVVATKKPLRKPDVSKKKTTQIVTNTDLICPECGEQLHFEGGCKSCSNCGYSKCG